MTSFKQMQESNSSVADMVGAARLKHVKKCSLYKISCQNHTFMLSAEHWIEGTYIGSQRNL